MATGDMNFDINPRPSERGHAENQAHLCTVSGEVFNA